MEMRRTELTYIGLNTKVTVLFSLSIIYQWSVFPSLLRDAKICRCTDFYCCPAGFLLHCFDGFLLYCFAGFLLHSFAGFLLHCFARFQFHCFAGFLLHCFAGCCVHCSPALLSFCDTLSLRLRGRERVMR